MSASLLRLFRILILAFSLIGCQNLDNKEGKSIRTFDLKTLPNVSNVKLTALGFTNIEYIPLETNDSSLIQSKYSPSGGDKILAGDDFFIIKHFTNVLKFRDNGLFIGKIGTKGRGPGEFLVCHDIDVDELGRIYIADAWKEMFFKYTKNGDLIKTFKSPLQRKAVEFLYFDGKFLCYNQNNLADIVNSFNVIDTNGIILKSFPNKYPFTRHPSAFGFNHEVLLYQFNNRIFTKEVYSDTIFDFNNLCFSPHIVIQVGDKLITPEVRSKTEGLEIVKNYINPLKLFEFGDYIYYEFIYKYVLFQDPENYGFIASKIDDFKALIDPDKGLVNDLDGGPNIIPITIKNDNTIVAMIEAIELKTFIDSDTFKNSNPEYPEKKEQLKKLANSLKETDNPVLILVSFNKIN